MPDTGFSLKDVIALSAAVDTLCVLAQHRPSCNVYARVTSANGCSCTFGPAYSSALDLLSRLTQIYSVIPK